jgi:hypothetical protein
MKYFYWQRVNNSKFEYYIAVDCKTNFILITIYQEFTHNNYWHIAAGYTDKFSSPTEAKNSATQILFSKLGYIEISEKLRILI